MRLYLSSYQLGAHPEWLVRLVRAIDAGGWWQMRSTVSTRTDAETKPSGSLRPLLPSGCKAVGLDLREHDPASIRTVFGSPAFVWVRG